MVEVGNVLRRVVLTVAAASLFGVLAGGAQPGARPNVVVFDSASTSPNFPYAVKLEVTLENRGQAASPPGRVEVTMRPRVSAGSRPKTSEPTMFDPVTESQEFPALQPNERKTITFNTPYQSRNAFKSMRGSFKTNNIDPTGGDVSVGVTTRVTFETP